MVQYWDAAGWQALQQGVGVASLFSYLPLRKRRGKTLLFVLLREDCGGTELGKKLSFIRRFYIRERYAPATDSEMKTGISWPRKQAIRSRVLHVCPISHSVATLLTWRRVALPEVKLRARLGSDWKPQVSSA